MKKILYALLIIGLIATPLYAFNFTEAMVILFTKQVKMIANALTLQNGDASLLQNGDHILLQGGE